MRIAASVYVGLVMLATPALAELKPVAPAPGRDVVKPMKPDWCPPGFPVESTDENRAERTVSSTAERMPTGVGLAKALDEIAQSACKFPDSPAAQAQVAAWRQSWINAVGVSEKEDRAALKIFFDAKAAAAQAQAWCDARRKGWAGAQLAEYNQITAVNQLVCAEDFMMPRSMQPSLAQAYWLDRAPETTQLARLAHVHKCLTEIWWNTGTEGQSKDLAAAGHAFCAADARALNRDKLMAELDALKAPPVVRARVSLQLLWNKQKLAQAKAHIAEAAASDPKVTEVFVDGLDKALADWQKLYAANKEAFDAAYAVEDKIAAIPDETLTSAVQTVGCEPLRKAYRGYVASKHPKMGGDVIIASTDEVGYPLLLRLALCDAAEGRGFDASAELAMLSNAHRIWNGPRIYAFNKIMDSTRGYQWKGSLILNGKLYHTLYDSRDQLLRAAQQIRNRTAEEFGSIVDAASNPGSITSEVSRAGAMFKGRVASVKKTKDGVAVVFKQEKWQEPKYDCVKTGIAMWEHDGTPIFSHKCKFSHMEQMEFKAEPVTLVGFTADLVKPGMLLKYLPTKDGGKFWSPNGFAVVLQQAAPGAKEAKTVNYFGFALK